MGVKTNAIPKVSVVADNDEIVGNFSGSTARVSVADFTTHVISKVVDVDNYYGMIIHQDTASPSGRVEYTGLNKDFTAMTMNLSTGAVSYGSWASMPTLALNRPAMVKSNGTFDYWLSETDYTKKADETTASDVANTSYDGNAFSYFCPLWMRIKSIGTDLDVRFAYSQLETDYFEVCPEGKALWLPMFYGSVVDSKMRSISGTNVLNSRTTAQQKTAIEANNANAGYLFCGGKVMEAIKFLCVMWFKSTNSDTWGAGNRSGYNSSDTTTYGTKSNPIVGGGKFYGTSTGTDANKILHSVALGTYDVFLRDPYTLNDKGVFKVSKDYSYSESGAGFTNCGFIIDTAGWQKTLQAVEGYGALPIASGGSSSTYYCDYVWLNNAQMNCGLRLGNCNYGTYAGAFYLDVGSTFGYSSWAAGCALLLPTDPLAEG